MTREVQTLGPADPFRQIQSDRRRNSILSLAVMIVPVLGLALFLLYFLPVPEDGWLDFRIFVAAGKAIWEGTDLYDMGRFQYFYPPHVAYLFVPLAVVNLKLAAILWFWISLSLVALSCAGIVYIVGAPLSRSSWKEWGALLGVALFIYPTWSNFIFGQVDAFLLFLCVLSLLLLKRGAPGWGGIVLGLLASVKLIPLAFIALAIWKREFRYGVSAVVSFLVFLVTPIVFAPDLLHEYWFDVVPSISALTAYNNQSLTNLARLLSNGNSYLVGLAYGVSLVAMLIPFLVRFSQRGIALIEVALLISATLLFGPVVENHHLLLMLIPIWVALRFFYENRSLLGIACIAVTLLLYALPGTFPIVEALTGAEFMPRHGSHAGLFFITGTLITYIALLVIILRARSVHITGVVRHSVLERLCPAGRDSLAIAEPGSMSRS